MSDTADHPADELDAYREIARRCRWRRLGYNDRQPAGPQDIIHLLADLDRHRTTADDAIRNLTDKARAQSTSAISPKGSR